MACFLIGSLSIIGLPPAGGMWSKLLLVEGTAASGDWLLVGTFLVSSLLNIVYLLSIPMRAFLRPERTDIDHHGHGEAPLSCQIAMVTTATITVLLFLKPDLVYNLVQSLGQGVSS